MKITRRPFMKTALGASLAALTARAEEPPQPGKKLGWALVGLGSLSTRQIAPALLKSNHSQLAAVVTGTPEKGVKWREKYGLAEDKVYSYETFDKIIDDPSIDVVYIVLPNSMHHEFTIRAAKAGKHVFCEKPMANSAKECREMIAACEAAKRQLGIGYRCQFEPHHREAMRFAREQVFGPLQHVDAGFGFAIDDPTQWRLRKKLAGGGALMDVGIYALQACRYLAGDEPVEVAALETKTDPVKFAEVDETINWMMKFPSGMTANCLTTYHFSGREDFTAYGTKGRFGMKPCFGYSNHTGWTSDPKITLAFPQTDHFVNEMDAFSLAIIEGKPFEPSGKEGLRDLLVIEAIYRSIASGKKEAVAKI
ncbi:MAG: Gfo/Idh/MocA family oxidoreductase [Luteolibacter sp.]